MFSLLLSLVFCVQGTTSPGAKTNTKKMTCTADELQRKDCRLAAGNYNLRLLQGTIAWNDGTWHTVDPMPLTGEKVQWEKATFEFFNGWPILQLWIWDGGEGEAEVQSLHWVTVNMEGRRASVLARGIVRKRRLKEGQDPNKPQYIYDAMERHRLRHAKGRFLEWQLAHEKRLLERPKHGI